MTTRFSAGPDEAAADDTALAGDAAADDGPSDAATDAGAGEVAEAVDAVEEGDDVGPVVRCVDDLQPTARLAVTTTATVVAMPRLRTSALIDTKCSVGDQHCGAAQQQMAGIVEPNTQPAARKVDDVFAAVVSVERGPGSQGGHDRTRAAAT